MHILTPWIEFDVIAQPDETCREELKRQHAHLARLQTVPCTAVKDAQFPGKLFAATAFIADLDCLPCLTELIPEIAKCRAFLLDFLLMLSTLPFIRSTIDFSINLARTDAIGVCQISSCP